MLNHLLALMTHWIPRCGRDLLLFDPAWTWLVAIGKLLWIQTTKKRQHLLLHLDYTNYGLCPLGYAMLQLLSSV